MLLQPEIKFSSGVIVCSRSKEHSTQPFICLSISESVLHLDITKDRRQNRLVQRNQQLCYYTVENSPPVFAAKMSSYVEDVEANAT